MSHQKLAENWRRISTARGSDLALIRAETGASYCFEALNAAVSSFLEQHAELTDSKGQVWALGAKDPVTWVIHCLAGIQCGAVILPVESNARGGIDHEALTSAGAAYYLDDHDVHALECDERHAGLFLIKMTSGSTGEPARIPFTESEMIADGRQILDTMVITSQDVNYGLVPLGHSYGLGNLLMPLLLEGVPIVFSSAPFPQVIADELQRYRCSVMAAVPPLIKALGSSDVSPKALQSLRLVVSAGSRLTPEIAQAFAAKYGVRVRNFYGSSETGGICYDREGRATETGRSVGHPMHHVRVRVDASHRIYVSSPAVSHALFPDGEVPMADYGYMNQEGELCLEGRRSDLVKIGGKRLYLAEVEQALLTLDGVADAYVTSIESRRGEDRLAAVIQGDVTAAQLRQGLLQILPEWKVPRRFQLVERMPYTDRGKKDSVALRGLLGG